MKYWIDTSSESDNVIAATDSTLLIGSCDKEHCDEIAKQFETNKSPEDVLGSENLKSIPFTQIQNLTSKSTDKEVKVSYKAKKELEEEVIYFDSMEKKNNFVESIDGSMPSTLEKTQFQQNPLSAAAWPLCSLAMCAFVVYFYIDKFRWPVVVIGALWAAYSLYSLFKRLTTPPEITRWNIKGRHARKIWHGAKFAGSVGIAMAVVAAISQQFPDSWGEKAISDRLSHEMLSADDIPTLVSRGGDINFVDEYGDTPLRDAIYYEESDLAVALVEAGADLNQDYDGVSALEFGLGNGADPSVLEAMLKKGAKLTSDGDNVAAAELIENYGDPEIEALFKQYMPMLQTSLE